MQEISVQEMINNQLDHFISKEASKEGKITLNKLTEISSWVGAYVIRQRHLQTQNVSEQEMQMVMGSVGNFCKENFGEAFTEEDFNSITLNTVSLLKRPTFDADAKDYFSAFYK